MLLVSNGMHTQSLRSQISVYIIHTHIVHNIETRWWGKRNKEMGQQRMSRAMEMFPSFALETCVIVSAATVQVGKKHCDIWEPKESFKSDDDVTDADDKRQHQPHSVIKF